MSENNLRIVGATGLVGPHGENISTVKTDHQQGETDLQKLAATVYPNDRNKQGTLIHAFRIYAATQVGRALVQNEKDRAADLDAMAGASAAIKSALAWRTALRSWLSWGNTVVEGTHEALSRVPEQHEAVTAMFTMLTTWRELYTEITRSLDEGTDDLNPKQ